VSISPTFLLRSQKRKKTTLITDNLLDCLLALLGSARVKAARKNVGEIVPRDFVLAC